MISFCDNLQLSGRAACCSGYLAVYLLVYLFLYIVHICYSHINMHCTVWRYDAYPISSIYQCASCQKIAGGSAWPETKREMRYGDWNTTEQWE